MNKKTIAIAALAALVIAAPASAEITKSKVYGDWRAIQTADPFTDNAVCSAVGLLDTGTTFTTDIFQMTTKGHNLGPKGELTKVRFVVGGSSHGFTSTPKVRIGDKVYTKFSPKFVDALKTHDSMIVRFIVNYKVYTESASLDGFAQAWEKANQMCGD